MGNILSLFAGPYGLFVKLAIVTALVGGFYMYARHQGVESMRPKVEAAESDRDLWKQTAQNRLILMQAQNKAVEALKTSQDTKLKLRDAKLAEARIEADKWRNTAERRADLLANLNLPENECQALTVLINEARK